MTLALACQPVPMLLVRKNATITTTAVLCTVLATSSAPMAVPAVKMRSARQKAAQTKIWLTSASLAAQTI